MIRPEQGRCDMEQEYRYLSCKKCNTTLKIEALEEQIGEVLNFECPTCGNPCQIIIFRRPSMDGLLDQLVQAAWKDILEGSNAQDVIETIKKAGYTARLSIDVTTEPILQEVLPEPKVIRGQVDQGVYTEDDAKYLSEMQITFSEED